MPRWWMPSRARNRVERLLTRSATTSTSSNALHAPEVECIWQGQGRTRYEFGVKTLDRGDQRPHAGGQFILGMQALPAAL